MNNKVKTLNGKIPEHELVKFKKVEEIRIISEIVNFVKYQTQNTKNACKQQDILFMVQIKFINLKMFQ